MDAGGVAGETRVLHASASAALAALRHAQVDDRSIYAVWVPGRIEFLGKHTDYAGGRSLLCAVERGICLVAVPRADRRLRVVDAANPTDVADSVLDAPPGQASHWSTYPFTAARRIARNFPGPLAGADIAFASNLPPAAGMSSSSALVVATFLALAEMNRLVDRAEYRRAIGSREDLAGYLGAVENGMGFAGLASDAGVGTFGGSEDHTAILCARPNALVQYSFMPVRLERTLPLPGDCEFVVAVSGVMAEKTGAARERYNRLSLAAQAIAAKWRDTTGRTDATLGDAIASGPAAAARIATMLRDAQRDDDGRWLQDRFAQFALEHSELIPAAASALERGDLHELGAVVDRSQAAVERLLGNQIAETAWLARDARERGAVAASAFGAGFGGSVWSLVRSADAEAFCAAWAERYARHFPAAARDAKFFRTRAGPPATRL